MTTRNLFKSSSMAKIAEAHPVSFFDIGARGGFDAGLWPIAFATQAIGFEPDPAAFEKLTRSVDPTWKETRILPTAISGENGVRILNVPSDPQGASLLGPGELTGPARSKNQFFEIVETHQVETITLDDVLDRFELPAPEYLKIDIEGVEFEVLKSSPKTLDRLLAVKVEVAFDHLRKDQPIAHQIMELMEKSGFVLMDFIAPSHWRTDGNVTHPLLDKTKVPYSRGQLMHGDYLYFRRPGKINFDDASGIQRGLQLGLIAMSFGYFDFAVDIFSDPHIRAECEKLGCNEPLAEIAKCSKSLGRIETKNAFKNQLRGLGPFIRRVGDLIFP